MADLKTTIAQTENLKNKVKLAKDRINETVVRGGGITSKSLSEIPDNINKMLGQYSKFAKGNSSLHSISVEQGGSTFSIETNANFDIKEGFLKISIPSVDFGNFEKNCDVIIDINSYTESIIGYLTYGTFLVATMEGKSKSKINFRLEFTSLAGTQIIPSVWLDWYVYG